MPEPTRVYGGQTADERRTERRSRLIAAARELLRTEGWTATSMRSVCAHAKLTDRYFYESFSDRDALLSAVFDEIQRDAIEDVVAALSGASDDPRERARAAIGALVDRVGADAATRRALFDTPDSPAVHRHRRRALRTFALLVADEMGPAGDTTATDREMTAHALIGAFGELLTATTEGELDVTTARLVDHAAAISAAVAEVTSRS